MHSEIESNNIDYTQDLDFTVKMCEDRVSELRNTLKEFTEIADEETKINKVIIDKFQKKISQQEDIIKKLEKIVVVPRLHTQYLRFLESQKRSIIESTYIRLPYSWAIITALIL